jgi:hypothetical protein
MGPLLLRIVTWLRPLQPDVTPPAEKRQLDAKVRADAARLRVLRNEAELITRRYRNHDHPPVH